MHLSESKEEPTPPPTPVKKKTKKEVKAGKEIHQNKVKKDSLRRQQI